MCIIALVDYYFNFQIDFFLFFWVGIDLVISTTTIYLSVKLYSSPSNRIFTE